MANRVTGMYSGLDTESLIEELVEAKITKVTTYKNSKTKLEWKQEKWSALNTKIKSLQSTIVSMQYSSDYLKKKTTVSNSNAVSVITGSGAMNSVQSLTINKLAKTGYLTGAKLSATDGSSVTSDTTMSQLADSVSEGSFTVTSGGKSTSISITADTTIGDVITQLKSAGVNANYDATNQRIFIGAAASGASNDFTITADDANGLAAMNLLGINASTSTDDATYTKYQAVAANLTALTAAGSGEAILEDTTSDLYELLTTELGKSVDEATTDEIEAAYQSLVDKATYAQSVVDDIDAGTYSAQSGAIRLAGSDAEITLNGATFTSNTNNIEVNGLTFTALATTADGEEITVTTQDDTDGIYDMIKSFIKQYNELIIEMDKLYNADSASDYDVLSDEEKDSMSDSEIEKWETTIKDSLLRNDTSLSQIFTALKEQMAQGYEVNGKTMYLSDFGISTLSYFEAADNEKAAYHIDGDSDDSNTSGNEDKLKTMIANDSATTVSFFTALMNSMYTKMSSLSSSTDYSSYGSFYDDKKYKTDLSDWDDKIDDAEEKLEDYEDRWYSKFSSMETALSKLDSKSSYISNLFS